MSRTLVIRLSALGDVAMLIPVLYSLAKAYPGDEFILVTKSPLLPLFDCKPQNIRVVPVFTKDGHAGLGGLWRLIRELFKLNLDQIVDLHNVLRSKQIRLFFRLIGKKAVVIDKGKQEKRALTRKKNKILKPLECSVDRYVDAFHRLGYDFTVDFHSIFDFGKKPDESPLSSFGAKEGIWVGFAPFAKHSGKTLPLETSLEVIRQLADRPGYKLFLFGGKEEETYFKEWENNYPSVVSLAGRFRFLSELEWMENLDVMISMDSGNMHLASLVGTPVVSVWGATHPYAGFYGYKQDPKHAVQMNLFCRPCSVFGDKPCYRKDYPYECLYSITPEMIVQKLDLILVENGKLKVES